MDHRRPILGDIDLSEPTGTFQALTRNRGRSRWNWRRNRKAKEVVGLAPSPNGAACLSQRREGKAVLTSVPHDLASNRNACVSFERSIIGVHEILHETRHFVLDLRRDKGRNLPWIIGEIIEPCFTFKERSRTIIVEHG